MIKTNTAINFIVLKNFDDVVLGFANLEQYTQNHPCFGATIGRYANRVKNAAFTIDGITYQLERNDGQHCIHGANEFNRAVWTGKVIKNAIDDGVEFSYFSPDGSKGFPGNLLSRATYTLGEDNSLHIKFEANTDKATHVSMTQHSYFNLSACKSSILDHQVRINADYYTEIDEDIVPTGLLGKLDSLHWDLRELTSLKEHIFDLNHGGYHFNYVFNKKEGELKKVIEVIEPISGRTMEVFTTQPGVQFYSGNAISDALVGKNNIPYKAHMGLCLETQHFPASPNFKHFPSTLLRPEDKYEEVVIYKFGVKE